MTRPTDIVTFQDIILMPVQRTDNCLNGWGALSEHFPELDARVSGWQYDLRQKEGGPDPAKDTRLRVNWVHYLYFDARRFWALGYVTFDDKPFMVIRNAGREGQDSMGRAVFDVSVLGEAVQYVVQTYLSHVEVEPADVVKLQDNAGGFVEFYGSSIDTTQHEIDLMHMR